MNGRKAKLLRKAAKQLSINTDTPEDFAYNFLKERYKKDHENRRKFNK